MNLPHLPSKFSSGETLTAAKLNALVDWMRDVARLLPGLQVNTGRGLIYSRSSAGTTVSLAHGYIQGSDSGEDAAAVPAARPRRLFAWSTETGGDAERPTWIVRVTDGLALVRPNQASAPEPCVAGVILGAGAGTVNVGIAKTELSFTPKKEASEFSLVTAATLEDDDTAETGSVTELITVNVPGYELKTGGNNGISVVSGISSATSTGTVFFTIPKQTSSKAFATAASLELTSLLLSATPNGANSWTHDVVLNDVPALNKVTLTTELISFPEKMVSAEVRVPVPSASTTTIALQATGTASSTEVSVTIPIAGEKKLSTEITKIGGWLVGGSVSSRKLDETEIMTLDFSAAKIGTAKLAGEEDLAGIAPTTKDVQISTTESTLHWVKGERFDLTPADAGTLISIEAVCDGGQIKFAWHTQKLPANEDGSTDVFYGDEPQVLKLLLKAQTQTAENSETIFGVVSALEDAWNFGANWHVRVPMAVVFKNENESGAEVEPLTWGCVEIKPRLRVTLNGGGEQSENSVPASTLSAAQIDALAVSPTSAYDLETKDFL
ncbi:MAG: hypothetical protein E7037_05555 [Verrucomicrobia bacterium]|nr:hypothetical protein [Verrucomicrobiota bacterium]